VPENWRFLIEKITVAGGLKKARYDAMQKFLARRFVERDAVGVEVSEGEWELPCSPQKQ
jgi:hypothetical protein